MITVSINAGVATLRIQNPRRRNALPIAGWQSLRDAAQKIDGVRAVVVTGEGPNFCAGMDLSMDNELLQRLERLTVDEHEARRVIEDLKDCLAAIAGLDVPTFAAIEGACLGAGVELALACDVRIAGRGSFYSLPEVQMGMIPDMGGCTRLTRLVGPGRAADLIVTGRRVDAEEAFALGLVERLCDSGSALDRALEAAAAVARGGPHCVRLALAVVRSAADLGLDEALAVETHHGAMALGSREALEGVRAFGEKRPPKWD